MLIKVRSRVQIPEKRYPLTKCKNKRDSTERYHIQNLNRRRKHLQESYHNQSPQQKEETFARMRVKSIYHELSPQQKEETLAKMRVKSKE
jgi:hypothetical protein